MLTIAIPTYKRIINLKKLIVRLAEILDGNNDVDIIILNNDSNKKLSIEDINPNKRIYKQIKIYNWKTNVGAMQNLLRAYEYSEGEFIWVLGDDDLPKINSLEIIKNHINKYPTCKLFNYFSPHKFHCKRENDEKLYGANSYLSRSRFLGDYMFISNLIFSKKFILPALTDAINWQSSYLSQLIISINILGSKSLSIFSAKTIIETRATNTKSSTVIRIAGGMALIRMASISRIQFDLISNLIPWFNTKTFIKQAIIMSGLSSDNRYEAIRVLRLIVLGYPFKSFNLIDRLITLFFSVFLEITPTNTINSLISNKYLKKLFKTRVDFSRS